MSNNIDGAITALGKIIDIALGEHIVYKPSVARLAGSITSGIFLERIRHYWSKKQKTPFYKFNANCAHPLYRDGDSWQEELGFTRGEFEGAQRRICTRIMKGDKKEEVLRVFDDDGELMPKTHLVIYWRDSDNILWWEFNDGLFQAYLLKQANAEITNSQIAHYLVMRDFSITYVMQDSCDTLLADESTDESTDKKDSSSLDEDTIHFDLPNYIKLALIASIIKKNNPKQFQASSWSVEGTNTQPAEEKSIGEIEEIVEEVQEFLNGEAKILNDQYQEVVRRAFAPPGQPLSCGSFVGGKVKFLRGLWKEGEKGAGDKTLEYQLSDKSMSPAEIAGMTIWYRNLYKQDKLPTTMGTLRQRCDEFRALHNYAEYVAEGERRLEAIMNNGNSEAIEKKTYRYDNTRMPTEEDYAVPESANVEWNQEALTAMIERIKPR